MVRAEVIVYERVKLGLRELKLEALGLRKVSVERIKWDDGVSNEEILIRVK